MTAKAADYLVIARACERKFAEHGDTSLGVGWTREHDARMANEMMLEAIRPEPAPISVLDLGCGLSYLYELIRARGLRDITYTGLDISELYIAESRRKFPHNTYLRLDILEDDSSVGMYDYVFINGIFTYKGHMSQADMVDFFQRMVAKAFQHCRRGIAFNTMSKQVDWEREDLFHLPLDLLASFLAKEVSRHFMIRHDHGLFQQFVYVYRDPHQAISPASG